MAIQSVSGPSSVLASPPHGGDDAARLVHLAVLTLGVALAFYLTGRAAHALAALGQGTFVLPGVGIAVAALYIWRARAFAGVYLGAFAVELAGGHPFLEALLGAALMMTSALVVHYFLTRVLHFDGAFGRVRDGLALLAGVSLMVALKMASAVIHTYAMAGTLTLENVLSAWSTPMAAGAGMLIFTPLMLAWHACWREPIPRRQWIEALLLGLAMLTMGILAFCSPMMDIGSLAHLPYALFPIVFWAALRFRVREVATVITIAAGAGLWYTARGVGPFAAANPVHGQIALMLFLTALVGTGIIVVAAIRQEERASRAVRDRERRLSLLIDRMNEGLATFDRAGVFTFVSARFGELTGYAPTDLIGKCTMREIIHPDDRERLTPSSEPATAVAADANEIRLVKRSGEIMIVLFSRRELEYEDESDAQLHTFALITDITESKCAQDALRESEAKYRILVENQTELVLRVARDRTVVFASPSFRAFFGKREEEVIGQALDLHIHEEDRAASDAAWQRAWEQRETVHTESRVLTPRGWRWLASSAQSLPDCCDNLGDSVIMVARDVTDRHRAEELARAHLQQLAHVSRVASMGEMGSAIAHEINQPLAAIANYASASVRFLRSGLGASAQALQAMERVAAEAERAGEIVRRLRNFVRAEEGQLAAVSPMELIEHVVRLSSADARQSGVALETDCDRSLPAVLADPIQIEQVLLNLVRNAIESIDATPTRERSVRICAHAHAEPGELELTVTDTGPGLRADQLEKVFDAFYTTKTDGMGIGLALSRSIAEAHGGRLWASSARAGGATFHLTLPTVQNKEYAE